MTQLLKLPQLSLKLSCRRHRVPEQLLISRILLRTIAEPPPPSNINPHHGQHQLQKGDCSRPVRLLCPKSPFPTCQLTLFLSAILDLKLQRDKLHQYQRKITHILDLEHSAAKRALAAGDKSRALLALRRRKYQSSLLSKTDAQLATLEQLVNSIEFALVQKDVVYGLKEGNKVLKEIQKEMTLEDVERLMEETEEAVQWQEEVGRMLAERVTRGEEEEVEDELEALRLEVEGVKEGAKEVIVVPEMPNAPVKDPQEEAKKEEARKRILERRQREAQAKAREEEEGREAIPA